MHFCISKDSNNYAWVIMLMFLCYNSGGLVNNVRKRAKIRNRYNQASHLTQDTDGKMATSQKDITHESQESRPF